MLALDEGKAITRGIVTGRDGGAVEDMGDADGVRIRGRGIVRTHGQGGTAGRPGGHGDDHEQGALSHREEHPIARTFS